MGLQRIALTIMLLRVAYIIDVGMLLYSISKLIVVRTLESSLYEV